MTDITLDFPTIILALTGVIGAIITPLIIFFAKIWQRVGLLEERLESSIKLREQIQEDMKQQQSVFNPLLQKSATDIAVIKEKIERIEEYVDRERGWRSIHKKEENNDG